MIGDGEESIHPILSASMLLQGYYTKSIISLYMLENIHTRTYSHTIGYN